MCGRGDGGMRQSLTGDIFWNSPGLLKHDHVCLWLSFFAKGCSSALPAHLASVLSTKVS